MTDEGGIFDKPGVRLGLVKDDGSGLVFRLGISYNHKSFRWIVSCDILYGVKTMREELGVCVTSKESHT